MLAFIGATAPFAGLFGTVWGNYHALVAIGMSGSGMLDKVAGPVGEALIMTGIGLADVRSAALGIGLADNDELLPVEALGLDPDPAVA